MVRAGAAAVGGAPGAGDAVTRALREELKLKNGGRMPELKMPKTREREKEIPKDGYRVPPVLSNTFAVNSLLMQQPNKARVKDLRVEIEKQQQEAEAQREMLERQQKANMPVSARLREALAAKSVQVIHLFKSWDADGDGLVSKGEFARALTLLGVDDATADDMDELFDVLDDDGSGEISYQELRSGRRGAVTKSRNAMASVSGGGGGAPSDLDISLQGPAVSRQLKELVFTRQVTEIEAYEKEKEVKSFVAPGQPLMTADVEAATRDARAAFEDAAGRAERDVARGRRAVDATAERVPLALADVQGAAATAPTFDIYLNDAWGMRQAVIAAFEQGVRAAVVRARIERRAAALKNALAAAGLADRRAVRAFVAARAAGGAEVAAAAPSAGDGAAPAPAPAAAARSLSGIAPFMFPEQRGADGAGGGGGAAEPMVEAPIAPFDELRLLPLRVPRRYQRMGYAPTALRAPGTFPPLDRDRPLRVGAAYEGGAPLASGEPDALPAAPLPPPLLRAPGAWRPPAAEPSSAAEGDGEAGAEAEGEAAAARRRPAEAVESDPKAAEEARWGAPRVMGAPPPWDECDARQQLLATPLAANDAWEREPVGVGAGIELLGAPTLSSKYRFAREAWADADAPLPALMSGPRRADVDPALSDDESDTEIDGEWHPPTEERLRQLYTLPAPPAAEAEGEAAEGEAAAGGAAAEDGRRPRARGARADRRRRRRLGARARGGGAAGGALGEAARPRRQVPLRAARDERAHRQPAPPHLARLARRAV